MRELGFRENAFDGNPNIVPVDVGGGLPTRFANGYSTISAAGRESEAIAEVIRLVRRLRGGELMPPFATRPAGPPEL